MGDEGEIMHSISLCGKPCVHGHPCELPLDHEPADRHETSQCIFYDETPELRAKLDAARKREEPDR